MILPIAVPSTLSVIATVGKIISRVTLIAADVVEFPAKSEISTVKTRMPSAIKVLFTLLAEKATPIQVAVPTATPST